MPIIPANPKANYLAYRQEIHAAIQRMLDHGRYILSREVEAFEAEFAAYHAATEAVGVANGTDAIELVLRSLGVGPGDTVLTVSHTAVATVAAIELAGATPVLVDVDPERFTLAPQALRETLLELRRRGVQPRVVIPVHIYGCMADMPAILEAAEEFGLVVVEDAAQAHGARLHGRRAGAWGHAGTFSFYPTKNLGAIGDGGAIVTRDRELGTQARTLREYGWVDRYISAFKGMNSRLDELQAAILRVKLAHLDNDNEARTRIARVYDEGLRDCPIALPRVPDGVDHVYHQYVVRSDRRDELQAYLRGREIITLVHYPEPVHRQPAYTDVFHLPLPVTEQARLEVLSLPMYPELPLEHAEQTVEAVRAFFGC